MGGGARAEQVRGGGIPPRPAARPRPRSPRRPARLPLLSTPRPEKPRAAPARKLHLGGSGPRAGGAASAPARTPRGSRLSRIRRSRAPARRPCAPWACSPAPRTHAGTPAGRGGQGRGRGPRRTRARRTGCRGSATPPVGRGAAGHAGPGRRPLVERRWGASDPRGMVGARGTGGICTAGAQGRRHKDIHKSRCKHGFGRAQRPQTPSTQSAHGDTLRAWTVTAHGRTRQSSQPCKCTRSHPGPHRPEGEELRTTPRSPAGPRSPRGTLGHS